MFINLIVFMYTKNQKHQMKSQTQVLEYKNSKAHPQMKRNKKLETKHKVKQKREKKIKELTSHMTHK